MNQSRKFRRQGFRTGKRGEPLPPAWPQVEGAARELAGNAMKQLQQMLPGRGLVLLAIPSGVSSQDVEAMACVHNLPDRSQVASVFEAMLEWWSGEVITAQPDRAAVMALREGVGAISQIPVNEVARQIGETTMRLLKTLAKPHQPEDAIQDALLLAASALGIYGKYLAPKQHEVPGGPADGSNAPPREPLPPPREWPKGNTKETLVADLLERPQTEYRDQIITMAREGKFHDYESDVAAPKAVLIEILSRFGFPDLAGKARDGGYDDEHASVVQAEEIRASVGAEVYDSMIDPGKRGQA